MNKRFLGAVLLLMALLASSTIWFAANAADEAVVEQATPDREGPQWTCGSAGSSYRFWIEHDGNVWVQNASGSNEPGQTARVYTATGTTPPSAAGTPVATYPVTALNANTAPIKLGTITVLTGDWSWRVKGSSDCENVGTFTFDWNWTYEVTCSFMLVTWPANLPHVALDAKVRIENMQTGEEITIEWKAPDTGFPLGVPLLFIYIDHPAWPGWSWYRVEWVQVHGTNYHAEPDLQCEPTVEPTVDPTVDPTVEPTVDPTVDPTVEPTVDPTLTPTPTDFRTFMPPTLTPVLTYVSTEVPVLSCADVRKPAGIFELWYNTGDGNWHLGATLDGGAGGGELVLAKGSAPDGAMFRIVQDGQVLVVFAMNNGQCVMQFNQPPKVCDETCQQAFCEWLGDATSVFVSGAGYIGTLFSREPFEGYDVLTDSGWYVGFDLFVLTARQLVPEDLVVTGLQCSICPDAPIAAMIDGEMHGMYVANVSNVENLTEAFINQGIDPETAGLWARNISRAYNGKWPRVSGYYPVTDEQ